MEVSEIKGRGGEGECSGKCAFLAYPGAVRKDKQICVHLEQTLVSTRDLTSAMMHQGNCHSGSL